MISRSRKAAIVPIPNGRNPLTRKAVNMLGRAWHARDWDAPVPIPHKLSIRVRARRDGTARPPSFTNAKLHFSAIERVAGYGFSGFLGGAAGFS
jgi:hypothetical protein